MSRRTSKRRPGASERVHNYLTRQRLPPPVLTPSSWTVLVLVLVAACYGMRTTGIYICPNSGGLLHLGSPCLRNFWSTVLPLGLVASPSSKQRLSMLWAANSLDLILDFVPTYVRAAFNYASPFFLKRIIDADSLDQHTHPIPEKRALASIYAVPVFLSTLCKAQADVQHLWFGPTCIRSELMSAIYDKALKRKGISGLVDQDPKAAEVKGCSKADDRKAVADMGRIYFIYGAPFEIMIASRFLYQLLGLSPFAGFIDLFDAQPALRSLLARLAPQFRAHVRQRRIQLCEPFLRLVHRQFPRPTHASDPEKRAGPTVTLAAIVLLGADLNMMLAVPNDALEKAKIVSAPILEC
ncbi:hypothetical protein FOMPIDRAFT_1045061 [Fomitopsis schrenkii]|uniref:Uncharacterized protein n=1 Tax=Fomitopsis schrenkii TaxID=2126942 RepID=S8ENR4_FOMSC|nr:hypothetical protein FOMPIDRAFT_1045061 [Fomitopsis schrenkii]